MRSLGHLDSPELAQRLGDFLYVQGIENQIDAEDDGGSSIWVLDDAQLPQAAALFERFRATPDAPEFSTASTAASRQRAGAVRAENARRSTVADTARVGYEKHFGGFALLPAVLVALSVAVALFSQVGDNREALRSLHISDDYTGFTFLSEVRAGQVWRLVTPIFIHFGWLHLIFNMMWLRDLGTFIQNRFGATYLGVFVLVSAVLSNVGQYWWDGPGFGGMSGVNYAFVGFLWLRGKYDRRAAWSLNPTTVQTMLIWFILCLTGLLGPVANAAHFLGLITGMAWGFLSSGRLRFSR